MTEHTNEIDLVVKYADEKGGGSDGQLIIDDVELEDSRDNRTRHGIGNDQPQWIEKGNETYTFSTTAMMSKSAARALKRIKNGNAVSDDIYLKDDGVFSGTASGFVFNSLTVSASDGGDFTVSIDADLLGVTFKDS